MSLFNNGIRIAEEVFAHTNSTEAAIESLEKTCDKCAESSPFRKCHGCPIELKIDEFKRPRLILVKSEVASTHDEEHVIKREITIKIKEEVVKYKTIGGRKWIKYTKR